MKIKDGFAKRKIGSRYIVVTTGKLSKEMNIIVEMNETSSDIWDYIEEGMNTDQIASALSENYGISLEKAKSDTEKLIEQMKEAGIFES